MVPMKSNDVDSYKSVRGEGAGQENELRVMKPISGAQILLTFTYRLSALLTKC